MSKRAKRAALIGFAAGAAKTLQQVYQTRRAQEAEEARIARLEQIRAQERVEDRSFSREETDRSIAAQAVRDERQIEAQMQRDAAQLAAAERRDGRSYAQQRALIELQHKNRPPENTGWVEGAENGVPFTMTRAEFAALPPERRASMTFRGDYSQGPAAVVGGGGPTSRLPPGRQQPAAQGIQRPNFTYDPKAGLQPFDQNNP